MYYIMRQQIFWDGNKRTAVLSANYILINAGAGIININENQLEEFNKLLSGYYESDQDTAIMQWTYDHSFTALILSEIELTRVIRGI